MIEKLKKITAGFVMSLCTLSLNAQDSTTTTFNWNKVIDAIIQVESGGNVNARNGKCVGPMQISPVLVKECNNILTKRKSKKHYTLSDRYSMEKSKEMFILIQSEFNKKNSVERAIKGWNGGVHYKNNAKLHNYYLKVMRKIR